jgi:predicted chitinase
MPTTDILRRIWHYASAARMGAIAETGDAVFAEFGIDDPKVVAQLLASISHETARTRSSARAATWGVCGAG